MMPLPPLIMNTATASRRWRILVPALTVMFGLLLGASAATAANNEFANPSPSALPAASPYNSPAECQPTLNSPWCYWAVLPPRDPNNIETYFNCAYYAAERRPDLADEVWSIGYNDQGAWAWEPDAAQADYPVSQTPSVGDIFVTAPATTYVWVNGLQSVDPYGHVGYVEQVLPDGSFITSEGGWGADDSGGGNAWYASSMAQAMYFVGFKAPATNTPGDPGNQGGQTGQPPPGQSPISMRPQPSRIVRHGHRITLSIHLSRVSGSALVTARAGRRAIRLPAVSTTPSALTFAGRLAPGRWTLIVTFRAARGYSAPNPVRLHVSIP